MSDDFNIKCKYGYEALFTRTETTRRMSQHSCEKLTNGSTSNFVHNADEAFCHYLPTLQFLDEARRKNQTSSGKICQLEDSLCYDIWATTMKVLARYRTLYYQIFGLGALVKGTSKEAAFAGAMRFIDRLEALINDSPPSSRQILLSHLRSSPACIVDVCVHLCVFTKGAQAQWIWRVQSNLLGIEPGPMEGLARDMDHKLDQNMRAAVSPK